MVRSFFFLFVVFISFSNKAYSGPFTDNLTRCIVVSTSDDDYKKLVNWIFRLVAEHPHIISNIGEVYSKVQKANADGNIAEIFTELLTKRCRKEAVQAFKYEEDIAFFESFKTLGEVAMQKMMEDPAVSKSAELFTKYLDVGAIEEIFE